MGSSVVVVGSSVVVVGSVEDKCEFLGICYNLQLYPVWSYQLYTYLNLFKKRIAPIGCTKSSATEPVLQK